MLSSDQLRRPQFRYLLSESSIAQDCASCFTKMRLIAFFCRQGKTDAVRRSKPLQSTADDLVMVRKGPPLEATPAAGPQHCLLCNYGLGLCCHLQACTSENVKKKHYSPLIITKYTPFEGVIEEHEFSGSSSGAEDAEPPSGDSESELPSELDADEAGDAGNTLLSDPEDREAGLQPGKAGTLRFIKSYF